MSSGKLPASVTPYICGARLHAANKRDGGLRPIAVGNLERRLVSKAFVHVLNDRVVQEAIVRDPRKWVLQLDLVNAFNSLRWTTSCLASVSSCYGTTSHLQFGPHQLSSSSGVHQGDPLAGLLFALTLQPVIEQIEAEVPDG